MKRARPSLKYSAELAAPVFPMYGTINGKIDARDVTQALEEAIA